MEREHLSLGLMVASETGHVQPIRDLGLSNKFLVCGGYDVPDSLTDIAVSVARIVFPRNQDPALELGDFVQEILEALIRTCGTHCYDIQFMLDIATDTAQELLRQGNRHAHLPLDECLRDYADAARS
jgi:hypothetical protein